MAYNDTEKNQYAIEGATTPPSDHHGINNAVEIKGAAAGEAADVYGDVQTAEQYGYVQRK
jgi:amino acid transporter